MKKIAGMMCAAAMALSAPASAARYLQFEFAGESAPYQNPYELGTLATAIGSAIITFDTLTPPDAWLLSYSDTSVNYHQWGSPGSNRSFSATFDQVDFSPSTFSTVVPLLSGGFTFDTYPTKGFSTGTTVAMAPTSALTIRGSDSPFAITQLATFNITQTVSTDPNYVPEPATWAMMIGGFGLVGSAMRGRVKRLTRAVD